MDAVVPEPPLEPAVLSALVDALDVSPAPTPTPDALSELSSDSLQPKVVLPTNNVASRSSEVVFMAGQAHPR